LSSTNASRFEVYELLILAGDPGDVGIAPIVDKVEHDGDYLAKIRRSPTSPLNSETLRDG
jgi:hypothetical protein